MLLIGPVTSPALAAASSGCPRRRDCVTSSGRRSSPTPRALAWRQAFGDGRVARPRLDKADLIVGLGAEFLDRPEDGLEREFAARRSPDQAEGAEMSRFVQLEGRLTLTGANADRRIRVRDSHLARIGAALAHELIVVRRLGPLAADAEVAQALAPFAIDAVAKQAGIDAQVLKALAANSRPPRARRSWWPAVRLAHRRPAPRSNSTALLLNVTLGAFDAGLFDETAAAEPFSGGGAALAALADDMRAGRVELLLVAGVNPVYDAPLVAAVRRARWRRSRTSSR